MMAMLIDPINDGDTGYGAVGLDTSVTNVSGAENTLIANGNVQVISTATPFYIGIPAVGYHFVAGLEYGDASAAPNINYLVVNMDVLG